MSVLQQLMCVATCGCIQCCHADLWLTWLQVSRAGELAFWLVAQSQLHPSYRNPPFKYDMFMGGYEDPTTQGTHVRFERLTKQLQDVGYQRALQMVRQRRVVIETVAAELCNSSDETVKGGRLVELLETTPLDDAEPVQDDAQVTAAQVGCKALQNTGTACVCNSQVHQSNYASCAT